MFCDHYDEKEVTLEKLEESVVTEFDKAKTISGLNTVKRSLERDLDTVFKQLSQAPSSERKSLRERLDTVRQNIDREYEERHLSILGGFALWRVKEDLDKKIKDAKQLALVAFCEAKNREELRNIEKEVSALTYEIKQEIRTKLIDNDLKVFSDKFKKVIDSIDLSYIENSKTFEKEKLPPQPVKPKKDESLDKFLKANERMLFQAGFVINPLFPVSSVVNRPKMLITLEHAKKLGKQYDPLFEKYGYLFKEKFPKTTEEPYVEPPKPRKKSWLDKVKYFLGFKPKEEKPPKVTKEAIEEYFKNKRF